MKLDRLIGILSILLQQDKITANQLADKFEVSCRTILRDIDDISKSGIPIVTSQVRAAVSPLWTATKSTALCFHQLK